MQPPAGGTAEAFLTKALQNLAAAEADYAAARYDACANRTYYCCFQAAIAALLVEGLQPPGGRQQWSHDFVHAQFAGVLVGQRRRFPPDLRRTLQDNRDVRDRADYRPMPVTGDVAGRALRRARVFVLAVQEHIR